MKKIFVVLHFIPVFIVIMVLNQISFNSDIYVNNRLDKLYPVIFGVLFCLLYLVIFLSFYMARSAKSIEKIFGLLKKRYFLILLSICTIMALLFSIFHIFNSKIIVYGVISVPLFIFVYHLFEVLSGEGNDGKLDRKQTKLPICLILVLLLTFCLRLPGVFFDYPFFTHPDEYAVVEPARKLVENGALDPDMYKRPNHDSIFIGSICYDVISKILHAGDIKKGFSDNPFIYYVSLRLVTVIESLILVVMFYLIGSLFSKRTGFFMGLICGVFPLFTEYSTTITPDILLTLLITASIYHTIKYIEDKSYKRLFFAVLFASLSAVEKYPGVLVFVFLLLVVIFVNIKSNPVKKCFVTISLFTFITFIISPYIFIRFYSVVYEFIAEANFARKSSFPLNIYIYTKNYLINTGVVFSLLTVTGFILMFLKDRMKMLPLFASLFFMVCLSGLKLWQTRWGLPMYILPIAALSYGIDYIIERIHSRKAGLLSNSIIVNYIACIFLWSSILLGMLNFAAISFKYIAEDLYKSTIMTALESMGEGTNFAFDRRTHRFIKDNGKYNYFDNIDDLSLYDFFIVYKDDYELIKRANDTSKIEVYNTLINDFELYKTVSADYTEAKRSSIIEIKNIRFVIGMIKGIIDRTEIVKGDEIYIYKKRT